MENCCLSINGPPLEPWMNRNLHMDNKINILSLVRIDLMKKKYVYA